MDYDNAKPFDFADLQGKPEPEAWGPKYSKPTDSARSDVDRWPSNCASGQKFDFDNAKHRAKMRTEFTAQANADKSNWAQGKLTISRVGMRPGNIEHAYKMAMAEKRARLASEPELLAIAA